MAKEKKEKSVPEVVDSPKPIDVNLVLKAERSQFKIIMTLFLIFVVVFFLSFILVSKSVNYLKLKNTNSNSNGISQDNDTNNEGGNIFKFSLIKKAFADSKVVSDVLNPSLPFLKPNTQELENLKAFNESGVNFSSDQLAALNSVGFFLEENKHIGDQISGTDDFSDSYKMFSGSSNKLFREPYDSVYISSDFVLHLYHILIDRSFQKIEEEKFYPIIQQMSEVLFADSLEKYNNSNDPILKDSYKRLTAFYLIPLVVLDSAASNNEAQLSPSDFSTYAMYLEEQEKKSKELGQADLKFSLDSKQYKNYQLSDEIFELAKKEIDLIAGASGMAESPLFTPYRNYFLNDYSQFKPRSHYTANNILKSYFIAMMWYGRMGFSLDSPDLTRDAIISTGQLNSLSVNNQKISEMYETLSSAIEFFVGEVDDLTPYEYTQAIRESFGENLVDKQLKNEEELNRFIAKAIKDLPKPRIVSEAVALYDDGGERDEFLKKLMQYRFFGQRFTPDAYVLNNLTQGVGAPDPETGQNLPSMTTALMPVYVIGGGNNDVVKSYIDKWVINKAPDSDKIIEKKLAQMNSEFSTFDESTWNQNIYWGWLNTYRTLLGGYGNGYPYFMTSNSWQKKNLGTVLGSYTELKHDTLLYAKQSYAELGGGSGEDSEIPPVPKGYVEADYIFWSKIVSLAEMTANGLEERKLMPEYFDNRYGTFIEYAKFFKEISAKQLQNEVISDDEFEKLRKSGHALQVITEALPGKELADKDKRAGIIADIHTDAVNGEILYEATGKPFVMYVAVKDINGTRLTRGLAFNHYEIIGPLAERYNDEEWQERVYLQNNPPELSEWSKELIK